MIQTTNFCDSISIRSRETTNKNGLKIASIVLNYNSDSDVMISVPQLMAQVGVDHTVIIVDNASLPDCIQRIEAWLHSWRPDAVVGSFKTVERHIKETPKKIQPNGRLYLVLNSENRGYSAGNNVGIRLADALGASAVLIANPDMRIDDPRYLAKLANTLFTCEKNYIAASRVVGLDGKDQNPQRESTFFEELFWPYFKLRYRFTKKNLVLTLPTQRPQVVEKVSGCCLLLCMHFLKMSNYLDDNVFLYCEEPILSARVRQMGGVIVFDPSILAVHAHDHNTKGSSEKAALLFINSRKYYIENYSIYNHVQKFFLTLSYLMMLMYYKFKLKLKLKLKLK
jgi:GT2 family glycosyltransferase